MPDFTTEQLTLGLAIAGGVALLSLLFAVAVSMRVKKLRREYAILRGEHGEQDVVAAVSDSLRRVEALDKRIDGIVTDHQYQAATARFAFQRFGLVRYDAFEEMGGRLSFSAALLDDHGDGIVISSINGRTETRTYAKSIKGMSSEHNLSDEERQAIAEAVDRSPRSDSRASASR
ncbi:MAG: DUF4446 family protein [Actinomycetota bacterium]|nr:DUF4446 family protein [Actinomycetota bacterium]